MSWWVEASEATRIQHPLLGFVRMSSIAWWVLGVVGAALLGFTVQRYVDRPKLGMISSGSGAGGNDTLHTIGITIKNLPGLLGVRLDETVIFGRQVHGHIERGMRIDRR